MTSDQNDLIITERSEIDIIMIELESQSYSEFNMFA